MSDTTNGQKADHFDREFLPSGVRMPAEIAAEFFEDVLARGGEADLTFEHPYWWAAFCLTGV